MLWCIFYSNIFVIEMRLKYCPDLEFFIFFILNDLRNLQEQVKKHYMFQKLFWSFTLWINFSTDLKIFTNSWLSAANFKHFYQKLEHFCLNLSRSEQFWKQNANFFVGSCVHFVLSGQHLSKQAKGQIISEYFFLPTKKFHKYLP